jgi:hypothetical protein
MGRAPIAAAWLALAGAASGAAAGERAAEAIVAEAAPAAPLGEAEGRSVLDALSGGSREDARAAIERILAARDLRFAAPLIELLRAAEVGIAAPAAKHESARALARLTGEAHGSDWAAWMRWYAASELRPPPGFAAMKGALLGRIDPRFAEVVREGVPSRIRVEEIVWGGVAFEGIPSLDRPATIPAAEATWLAPDEPVFGVAVAGEARAYPLRILDWHELANDVVGGEPIALAYCTLCGSGIAWRARAADGRTYEFGSSGLLLRSNKLMVDRETRTLWSQLTGRPVHGPLAASELALEPLPSVVSRWRDWRAAHPGTRVLSLATGHARRYVPGAPYGDYFASPATMFPAPAAGAGLAAKERVVGLRVGAAAKAYPVAALAAQRVVNDAVGGAPVVLVAARGTIAVEARGRGGEPVRYDAGGEVRAYARGGRRFAPGASPDEVVDERGARWRVTEEALLGPEGARAERLPVLPSYWFAWSAFQPEGELFRPEPPAP